MKLIERRSIESINRLVVEFKGRKFQGTYRKNRRAEKVRNLLWRLQRGRCFYCGEKMMRTDVSRLDPLKATIDHYIPRAAGGGSEFSNLVYSCQQCNQTKADTVPNGQAIMPLANTPFAHLPDLVEWE